jgi:hypothetical protein
VHTEKLLVHITYGGFLDNKMAEATELILFKMSG